MKPLPWRAESSRPGVNDRLTVLARPIRNPAPPLILLAQSARALAQGARAAGFTPLVIDRFADADTQAAAAECYRIPVTRDGALDPASVLTAVTELRVRHPAAELLWGGGLESQPVLLEHLSKICPVWGSSHAAARVLHDRAALRAACAALGVPVPAESQTARAGRWLRKRTGQAGGWHVTSATGAAREREGDDTYFQQWVPGVSASITLLVGMHEFAVLGFNRLLTRGDQFARDYRYLGAVGELRVAQSTRAECVRHATAFARHFGWRGLCGMDFIVKADGSLVFIDFNPRPVATVELHASPGLALAAHLAACRGEWKPLAKLSGVRAHRLVEADGPIQIPKSLDWPDWVSDRPQPEQQFSTGEPVCTVWAAEATAARTLALLEARAHHVHTLLSINQNNTINSGSIHAD
jgi:predicted ATP-grasp superfamily ATP-dependent carboligase